MATLDEQIAALKAALGSGAMEIEYETHRVKYRSVAELRAALSVLEAEKLKASQPAGQPTRTTFAQFESD